jgi:uncharacterized protein YaaW (UPF0174 family)
VIKPDEERMKHKLSTEALQDMLDQEKRCVLQSTMRQVVLKMVKHRQALKRHGQQQGG